MVYNYLLFTSNALLYVADMFVRSKMSFTSIKIKLILDLGSERKLCLRQAYR